MCSRECSIACFSFHGIIHATCKLNENPPVFRCIKKVFRGCQKSLNSSPPKIFPSERESVCFVYLSKRLFPNYFALSHFTHFTCNETFYYFLRIYFVFNFKESATRFLSSIYSRKKHFFKKKTSILFVVMLYALLLCSWQIRQYIRISSKSIERCYQMVQQKRLKREKKITVHRIILCKVLREVHLVAPRFFSHFARIIHLRLSTYGFTMNYEFTTTKTTHTFLVKVHTMDLIHVENTEYFYFVKMILKNGCDKMRSYSSMMRIYINVTIRRKRAHRWLIPE